MSWRDFKAFVLDRGLATVDEQGFVRPEEAWFDEPLTDALGKARDLAANGVLVRHKGPSIPEGATKAAVRGEQVLHGSHLHGRDHHACCIHAEARFGLHHRQR